MDFISAERQFPLFIDFTEDIRFRFDLVSETDVPFFAFFCAV